MIVAFALVFTGLRVNRSTQKSATWDEPMHLTSGYLALAHGDYRVDPSHPPFLRMWAALPLLMVGPRDVDAAVIDRMTLQERLTGGYALARRFLYTDNDADHFLYAARLMVVVLGVVLGAVLFAWTVEWVGFAAGVFILAIYAIEPNLAGHSALVTTDFAVTCFIFAAVYFLWRACRDFRLPNVVMVALCTALAAVTKFSAVILAPIIVVLIIVAARSRSAMTWRRGAALLTVVALCTLTTVWAVYGFRYAPAAGGDGDVVAVADLPVARQSPWLAASFEVIDRHHLLPNAFSHGFVFSQTSARRLPAFLAGDIRAGGWWYYFPFAFLIKTPIAILVLLAGGLVTLVLRRRPWESITGWFLLVPIAIYLVAAMTSGINIGLRHILPIYPFVLLIGAAWIGPLLARPQWPRVIATAIMTVAVLEFALTYPHPLAFFNVLVGGPAGGFHQLADSNLGWGGNLKLLKRWMDRNRIERINLAYFGSADPAYYKIEATYLPGSPTFLESRVTRPRLPGYVAISPTVLNGVYLQPWWRLFYRGFYDRKPVATIGNSIRVYWVETWPEAPARAFEPDVHGLLADALAAERWFDHASVHYREYLQRYPDSVAVWNRLGISSAESGKPADAIEAFRRAAALSPNERSVRANLATALHRQSAGSGPTPLISSEPDDLSAGKSRPAK